MSGAVVVVVTGHGKVHKAVRDFRGKVAGHPRCRLPADSRILGGAAAAYDFDLLREPSVYCRYRWCFRDLIVEMGLDPAVGHVQRHIGKRGRAATAAIGDRA